MRIIAGAWRGKNLAAPAGLDTRPTAARARQAVFDMLAHAPWSPGPGDAQVLDVFAGTGAYGLEALSRGAARAVFFEQAPGALAILKQNIAACQANAKAQIITGDALAPPAGAPHDLAFFDPPYGASLVEKAVAALAARGWLAPGALLVAELGPGDAFSPPGLLAARAHGKARLLFWRLAP